MNLLIRCRYEALLIAWIKGLNLLANGNFMPRRECFASLLPQEVAFERRSRGVTSIRNPF